MKRGASTIEYAIIVLLIINIILSGVAIAYISSVSASVSDLSNNVNRLSSNMEEVVSSIGAVSANLQAIATQLADITGIVVNLTRPAPPTFELTEPVQLRLVTFGTGTAWYVLGGALSEILTEELPAGSTIDVLPYAGGVSNPILVANKSAEIGLAFSTTVKWAYDGTGPYEKRYTNLRLLAAGLDIYWLGVAARADTDLTTLDDILNPDHPIIIGTGPKGSLSEFSFRQILEAKGLTYEDLEARGVTIVHAGMKSLKTQLQNRQMDGIVWVVTPGHPSWTELFVNPGMRFISLPSDIVNYLTSKYGYVASTIPANLFQNSNEMSSAAMSTVLITTTDMPDALAYHIVKAMVENRDRLVAAYKAMERWDPSKIEETATIPIHDGALKYYQEKGYI